MKPTKETYAELDRAYEFFNTVLFKGRLPDCLIVMQRKKGAYGYFWGETWTDNKGAVVTDEIALNPDAFRTRPLKETLSTLVHEMCHLQQHHFGTPSRNGYHNREWAQMMEAVGLLPTDTGEPGGKKTGQRMTHLIELGGAYDLACDTLIGQGFLIPWLARTLADEDARRKKSASKTKYTCEACGTNAWAKPDVSLICGECAIPLVSADALDEAASAA